MLDLDSGGGIFGPPFLLSAAATNRNRTASAPDGEVNNADKTSVGAAVACYCSNVHTPYTEYSLPYTSKTSKCRLCGKGRVPDVLFSTIEPPPGQLDITGRGCLLQAKVLRLKKDLKGEQNAKEISDALPFIEYEIHRQLMNKLKVKGMNSLFGLKTKISVGDRTIIGKQTDCTLCTNKQRRVQ